MELYRFLNVFNSLDRFKEFDLVLCTLILSALNAFQDLTVYG